MINEVSPFRQAIYDVPFNGALTTIASYIPIMNQIFFTIKSNHYWELHREAGGVFVRGSNDFTISGIEHIRNVVVLSYYMSNEANKANFAIFSLLLIRAMVIRSIASAVIAVVGYALYSLVQTLFLFSTNGAVSLLALGSLGPFPNYAQVYTTLGWPVPSWVRGDI